MHEIMLAVQTDVPHLLALYYAEADAGFGPSIGGSIQDGETNICTEKNPQGGPHLDYSLGLPYPSIPKIGEGYGLWAGAGVRATGTFSAPTIGHMRSSILSIYKDATSW